MGMPPKEWEKGWSQANKMGFKFAEVSASDLTSIIPRASPEAIDLIQNMLHYDSLKRPSAQQILEHPFFKVGMPGPHSQIWGHGSRQKGSLAKLGIDAVYKNPENGLFDFKKKSKNLIKETEDWELDQELDELMNDKIPNYKQLDKTPAGNKKGNYTYQESGRFLGLAEIKKLQKGDQAREDSKVQVNPIKWAGESSDDFDVFKSKKVKVLKHGNGAHGKTTDERSFLLSNSFEDSLFKSEEMKISDANSSGIFGDEGGNDEKGGVGTFRKRNKFNVDSGWEI